MRQVIVHGKLMDWMASKIKFYVTRFIMKTGLSYTKRQIIDKMHAQALAVYAPMLPIELQPKFEKLVNISRAQFLTPENYPDKPVSPEIAQPAKFRIT